MEGKSTNYRYYIVGAIVIVAIILLTVLIIKVSSKEIPEIDIDNTPQNTQNDTINTYSSTDIEDWWNNDAPAGKVWSETVNNITTKIARPGDNYTFGYWMGERGSYPCSGMDTIVRPIETAGLCFPKFIPNYKIKHISTLAEFTTYCNNSAYEMLVLDNDIDAAGSSYTPIDNFAKVLDGNGHTIRNIHITTSNTDVLFGCLSNRLTSGVIKNLTLENCSITDTGNYAYGMGGFVGALLGGVISNCVSKVTLRSDSYSCKVGGFTGYATGGVYTSYIENCTSLSSSISGYYSGLFIGYNLDLNCVLRGNKCEGSAQGPIS